MNPVAPKILDCVTVGVGGIVGKWGREERRERESSSLTAAATCLGPLHLSVAYYYDPCKYASNTVRISLAESINVKLCGETG